MITCVIILVFVLVMIWEILVVMICCNDLNISCGDYVMVLVMNFGNELNNNCGNALVILVVLHAGENWMLVLK